MCLVAYIQCPECCPVKLRTVSTYSRGSGSQMQPGGFYSVCGDTWYLVGYPHRTLLAKRWSFLTYLNFLFKHLCVSVCICVCVYMCVCVNILWAQASCGVYVEVRECLPAANSCLASCLSQILNSDHQALSALPAESSHWYPLTSDKNHKTHRAMAYLKMQHKICHSHM